MNAKKGQKITELCRTLDIQPYVLRYWETEFRPLQAPAGVAGQRTYSDADVALVRRIKQLLYEEGYTIAGAKKKLESEPLEPSGRGETAALFEHGDGAAPSEAPHSAPAKSARTAAAKRTLDTASSERIEQLRRGIEKALAEARSALKLLDKHPR